MSLSDFSIKNSVFAWMLMAGIILFGALSFKGIGVSQLPDVDFPIITIEVSYEGASPEVMESNVTDLLEDALISIEGIKGLTSTSKRGQAQIVAEFEINRNIDVAVREVSTRISQIRPLLPKDIEEPNINKFNPDDFAILWISLLGDAEPREMMEYARNSLKSQFQTIEGVGEIMLAGYIDPNIRIWINPEKLQQYELTVQDVIQSLSRQHLEVPGGRIETKTTELNVRAMGEALTKEEIESIVIDRRGGQLIYQPIYLKEVATVEKGLADIRSLSRTNQKPSIALGIKKQKGSNAVSVAEKVKEKIEAIRGNLPKGYDLLINFDSTKFIQQSTQAMEKHLMLAAILTAVVCLFFLGSINSTFNILMAIPTSIVGSFMVLYFLGFTLNTFTLLGLTLSIGIVVDDAIMVLENIVRHQEMGKSPLKAAIDGTREVSSAAIAATIAIVAVFAPVVFMKGAIGKFFLQFGVTLTVTVAFSLLEALTLTPMRCSKMQIAHKQNFFSKAIDRIFSTMTRGYAKLLGACLRFRWFVLMISIMLFGASLSVVPKLKQEMVPSQDQSSLLFRFKTPLGSSLHFTNEKMQAAETIVVNQPEVKHYFTAVGGFGSGGDVSEAIMFITLQEPESRPARSAESHPFSQNEISEALQKDLSKISNLEAIAQDMSLSGFSPKGGYPVDFSLRGPDWKTLTQYAETIIARVKADKETFKDVDTDYLFGQKELRVYPLRSEATMRGVSIQDLVETIQTLFGGVRIAKFTENERRKDIRIQLPEKNRQSEEDIKQLFVRNIKGELISLNQLVHMAEEPALVSITRKNREKSINITANTADKVSQDQANKKFQEIVQEVTRDNKAYRAIPAGAAEAFKESSESLSFALILGVIVAYMVLASQYNSFIHPIVVLLALPFSISGAALGLYFFNSSLNIYSFIGIILLMGIAKKNSILLVDFTNQKREEGVPVKEALMQACPQRLRPILMTSFATAAAAIPSAFSKGAGSETQVPMAVVILGGTLVSTFLTLFVIPCVYSLMSHLELKKHKNQVKALDSGETL